MNDKPFTELPAALVHEVLERTEEISQALLSSFDAIREGKLGWRDQLVTDDILRKDGNLPLVPIPTCSGIDGALALERLLAIDLVA